MRGMNFIMGTSSPWYPLIRPNFIRILILAVNTKLQKAKRMKRNLAQLSPNAYMLKSQIWLFHQYFYFNVAKPKKKVRREKSNQNQKKGYNGQFDKKSKAAFILVRVGRGPR